MEPVRLGIVGSGFGQRVLLPVFSRIEGVSVVAVCGTRIADAADARRAVYSRWPELLAANDLDAVAFAVPPLVQQEAALAAATRGLHIFCEKPLALVYDAALAIDRARLSSGVVGAVDFQFRKLPWFQALRSRLTHVGAVRELSIRWAIHVERGGLPASHWKRQRDAGGGAMSSFGCHLVDVCSWLLGPLTVLDYRPVRPAGLAQGAAEEKFELQLTNQDGVRVSVMVDTLAPVPDGLAVRVTGDRGSLFLADDAPDNYFSGFSLGYLPDGAVAPLVEVFPLEESLASRSRAIGAVAEEFVAAISSGHPQECPLSIGVENTRIVEAAASAVERGA